MNQINRSISLLIIIISSSTSFSQTCECTIDEVLNNSVALYEPTIGETITVSTVDEFNSAISLANSEGGNMTILIEDGTYAVASTDSYPYITASNLVIRSVSGDRDAVILTGQGMESVSPLVEIGLYVVGDNITIANLTIKEVGNHGIAVTGDNLLVHNVKIQDTYEQMIKGNSAGDGADNGIVQCSLFEYTAGIGPQFYIGGLDIHEGNDWVVSDNIFRNISSPSGSLAEHAVHFWDFSGDNIVERNWIINCDRGIGFGLGDSPNDGGIIRNNMIYNEGTHPFNDVGIGLETSPNTKVYNNTIYIAYPNAIEYRFLATTDVQITNNLCNKPISSRDDGEAVLLTNIEVVSDSWFVDITIGDLHLTGAIPEIVNEGTTLSPYVMVDIDKNPRPDGSQFDIGADEFISSSGINELTLNSEQLICYPNPTANNITIKSNELKLGDSGIVLIYNVLYEKVYSSEFSYTANGITVATSSFSIGTYFCQLSTGNSTSEVSKFMVQR